MSDWHFIEKDKTGKQNGNSRLKEIRISLGLTITALSKAANVSTKIISQTERRLTNPTQVTKHKIIKGLNEMQSPKAKQLKYEDIFPEDGK